MKHYEKPLHHKPYKEIPKISFIKSALGAKWIHKTISETHI